MSKSEGNIIDPQKLLKEYGAEAIRLWAATEGDLSRQDLKCSEERIKAELKTINKLLNITKFITQFKKPKKKKLTELDKLFIDYLDYETHHIGISYDRYNFFKPAVELRSFLWETFASHYLELVKARAYNEEKKFTKQESEAAIYTLYYLLERLVVLLSPIIPQVTSIIAKELKVSLEKFPKVNYPQLERRVRMNNELWRVNQIKQFNREVWKEKKDQGLSLKSPISEIKIPKQLKPYEKDLIVTHNLK